MIMAHNIPLPGIRIVTHPVQRWPVTMLRFISFASISLGLCLVAYPQSSTFPGLNGLGASTLTCIDRDGDGYGTGILQVGPFTDLVIDGSNAAKVTSASHSFVAYDAMQQIKITGGNGFKAGTYRIESVSSGSATLSASVGTVGSAGGSWVVPGCLGPDADDLDAAVHTGAQATTKYGTLSAFLSHLGYNPLRTWYISTTGNDSTCISGGAPVGIGSPCLNATPALTHLLAGDMVIYRGGTYTAYAQTFFPNGGPNGTSSNPIIVMAYPGERVVIDVSVNSNPSVNLLDRSWYIVDGLVGTAGLNGGCFTGGTSAWFGPNTFHDNIFRHIEAYNCVWGVFAADLDNILLEDYVGHDNPLQHAVYWGSTGLTSSNNIIRRTIVYNNAQNGYHMNGSMANLVMDQNIAYNNGIANFDWQNGIHNSFMRSNLSFQSGSSGTFDISLYPGTEGTSGCGPSLTDPCICPPGTPNEYSICAHDQTNNVIENNTFYQGQFVYDGSNAGPAGVWFARQSSCTTPACLAASMANNILRNNVVVDYSGLGNQYSPIWFLDSGTGWMESTTFDSIVAYRSDSSHLPGVLTYVSTAYPCNSPPAGVTLTNCINADPKFTAVDPSAWYTTPSLFDFHLLAGSPALHSGTSVGIPAYDLFGNPFASSPSMGAIETGSGVTVNPPTISITSPTGGSTVSGTVTASATASASGSASVTGVQFQVDGANLGSSTSVGALYSTIFDTTQYGNGPHTVSAIATDNGGNTGTASANITINNVVAAPTISAVTAGLITASAVSISWTTNTASDSQVSYGTTTAYGSSSTLAASLVTAHAVAISGLSPATTYHYEVLSRDGQGNLANSADFTFTTQASSSSLGWRDLTNTELQNVCPPNYFNGINYDFADHCGAVIAAWSGAVADTKRNRLIIWGGGHTDYSGNEVYSLNLGANPATLTRLTDPSDFTQNPPGCPDANVVDGTPVSRHTYGGLVYLPVQDKMFSFAGGLAPCGGPWSNRTYTLDLSQAVPKWTGMDPINGYNIGYQETTAVCGYDPNTQTVICNSTGVFFRYDPATNTNTLLSTGQNIPYESWGVIDPKRQLFIFMGTPYLSTTPQVVALDISSGSTFNVQDWSSQVTGCDALAGSNYPGLTYDSTLDRIVGWPNAGNTVYVFDPDQKICTPQTFANGPSNTLASTAGTFGRFQYFPALNAYGVVSLATLDAFTLTLSATAPVQIPCDVNGDGVVNVADVQAAVNQALGVVPCGTADLQGTGQCTVIDVQRVINTVFTGAACEIGP